MKTEYVRLADLLERNDGEWQRYIPGKTILQQLAAKASVDAPRLKRAYLKAALEAATDPFAEVKAIFKDFSAFGAA